MRRLEALFDLDFRDYQVLFLVVVAVCALLVASPALSRLLVYPRTEFFTEMWLLGPNHMAEDYPFNITRDSDYSIYLGLANHLGYTAYYLVEVKLRNETQSSPASLGPVNNRTPSSLSSLYNITAFVPDQTTWEKRLTFSFDYWLNSSLVQVQFRSMTFNNEVLNLLGESTTWNATKKMFLGDLVFETWIYNTTLNGFQFHGRAVDLKLNMTA
jgi:hypothetical protein